MHVRRTVMAKQYAHWIVIAVACLTSSHLMRASALQLVMRFGYSVCCHSPRYSVQKTKLSTAIVWRSTENQQGCVCVCGPQPPYLTSFDTSHCSPRSVLPCPTTDKAYTHNRCFHYPSQSSIPAVSAVERVGQTAILVQQLEGISYSSVSIS